MMNIANFVRNIEVMIVVDKEFKINNGRYRKDKKKEIRQSASPIRDKYLSLKLDKFLGQCELL